MKVLNHFTYATRRLSALLAAVAPAHSALALGGIEKATSTAQEVKTAFFALVGVVASIYLIFLAVMAFTEKKSWSDFGWGVVHVSVAGAAVALAAWAWTIFQ